MNIKVLALFAAFIGFGGLAYASINIGNSQPQSVEFYSGHSHDGPATIGAPQHSGGTDKFGCHNGSVPRHCH